MVGGCFEDFPHLNSGRDLQIFDAHIFRCCFVLLIGAVPGLCVTLFILLLLLFLLFILLLFLFHFCCCYFFLFLVGFALLSSVTLRYNKGDFA